MKTLSGTRLIVIAAIGLACIAAILLFAKRPPSTKNATAQPVQLSMREVPYASNKLLAALQNTEFTDKKPLADHKDHFKLSYDGQDVGNGTFHARGKANNNVTQHVALENSAELKTFINTAFP
jgi:hypothetical protein